MTLAEALSWVSEIVNEPPVRVRPETKRIDLAGWDSLGQLLLMSALDQQFGIKLTQDELTSLTSVQHILDILQKHGRLTTP